MITDVRAVLFDLDNTLYDRDLAFEKWTRAFVERQFSEANEEERAEVRQRMTEIDEHGYVTKQVLFTQVRALYPAITEEVEALCDRFYQEWLVYMTLDDGTRELLDALDRANIPYGIVTNGPPQQHLKIRQLGLDKRVHCLFVSAEFGCDKPDAAIFQAAASCLGVPCEQILFVGDNPEADICGARGVGMTTVWRQISDIHQEWPSTLAEVQPDHTIFALRELIALLNLDRKSERLA
jgi:putative hydrolase of the HAD superfamily